MFRQIAAVVAVTLAIVASPGAALFAAGTIDADAGPRLSTAALMAEAIRASGVDDPSEVERYGGLLADTLDRLVAEAGERGTAYGRARRLHRAMHRDLLVRYRLSAEGIPALLDNGDYNCVSASFVYALAAERLGFEALIVESGRHIFVRLLRDGRSIDVESVSPDGFDFSGDLRRFRRFVLAYKFATTEEMETLGPEALLARFSHFAPPVSLERALAFLWHNTGTQALARGDVVRAARCFQQKYRRHPMLAAREEITASPLAHAFRIAYEAGRFTEALDVAAVDVSVFPTLTSPRDRLLGAALKLIQRSCDDRQPSEAEEVLDRVALLLGPGPDLFRFQREVCPEIAAAAVRAGDRRLARRAAALFSSSQVDPVESARLTSWVEERLLGGISSASVPLSIGQP